jgi:drug/metabolite transporter (DMT)-like permease
MLVGLIVVLPAALLSKGPLPDRHEVYLMLFVGMATLVGLLIVYSALRDGAVSVVIPIVSAEGAVAAGLAWASGEIPNRIELLGMITVVGSVVTLVALSADPGGVRRASRARSAALAAVACLVLGTMLFAQGRLGDQVSLAWSVLPSRAVTVALLTIPLAARGRLRVGRETVTLVVLSGLGDVGGMALFVLGGRRDIAITSVLASQYAVVSVLLAALLFGERLRLSQRWAVAVLVCGVALVAGASA